jgi:hypothetical protein
MSKAEKMSLLKNYYMTILTYGAETWAWTKENISRPTAAEMRILRSTEGKAKNEIIRNKKSRDNLNIITLEGKLITNTI